jgi:hypothetical protein
MRVNARTTEEHDMAETITSERDRRELAHRSADGIEVTLLWIPDADAVAVRVRERDADNVFEIDVARDQALNAFHHPYAYAALRAIHTTHSLGRAA